MAQNIFFRYFKRWGGKAISILNSIEIDLNELRKKIELLNPAIIDASSLKLNEKKNLHLTRQAREHSKQLS
ncbi:MAG: hypothetical protein CM15mP102_16240 [Flavobacteriales bacterium]|nr:MAG: hypothetical protein CM15mP102_16240 [Flavobacteriales bacterium]